MKAVLLPPASLLLAIGAGWLLQRRWPVLGRWIMSGGFVLLYALCTPIIASSLLRSLESDPPVNLASLGEAGAIVVLGGDLDDAKEYGGDSAGPLTLARIRYAAWLQRRTKLPILITGGQLSEFGPPVSAVMKRVLADEFGISARWVETASSNTWENAAFSAQILLHENIARVLLVTHAWHMPRATAAFTAAGIAVIPAPTSFTPLPGFSASAFLPDAKALLMSAYAVHEMIGVIWYRLV